MLGLAEACSKSMQAAPRPGRSGRLVKSLAYPPGQQTPRRSHGRSRAQRNDRVRGFATVT